MRLRPVAAALAALSVGALAPLLAALCGASRDAWGAPAADSPRDAGAPASDAAAARIPPDPPPLRERAQWIFDLKWDRGDVYLLGVHKIELPAPQETPRAMGRFALELFEGPTLIERVRFDFPMLGDELPRDAGFRAPPGFGKKLSTRIGVMFPATARGTRLQLWDRAEDRRWDLPWPPVDTRYLPRDGGADEDAEARK